MNQREIILSALAPAKGELHSPVQVQKLIFLIDRNLSRELEGPIFSFAPYNYGPFDKQVYAVLEELAEDGFVDIIEQNNYRNFKLTVAGQEQGKKILKKMPEYSQKYISDVSEFVRRLTFTQLVTAIYQAYPDMRANSVFQG